ncbi:hypothetical protein K530_49045 [Streptomyces noursei CCRC 11814]|nr:hypothetical protein K530_49045 [Streptomyces noursei CCRC 11814]
MQRPQPPDDVVQQLLGGLRTPVRIPLRGFPGLPASFSDFLGCLGLCSLFSLFSPFSLFGFSGSSCYGRRGVPPCVPPHGPLSPLHAPFPFPSNDTLAVMMTSAMSFRKGC